MRSTQDALSQAKDKLMLALRKAESEGAPAAVIRKIEKLCGDAESLQHKVSDIVARKR